MTKIILTLLLMVTGLAAAEPSPPGSTPKSVEAEWQEIQDFMKSQRAAFTAALHGRPFAEVPRQETTQFTDPQAHALRKKLETFYAAHADSPLRWSAVHEMINMRSPSFIVKFGPNFQEKGLADAEIDESAKAAWLEKNVALALEMAAAPDTPPSEREYADFHLFIRDLNAAAKNGAKPEVAEFRRRFDAFLTKYPDSSAAVNRVAYYLGVLDRLVPGSAEGEWRHYAESPVATLRETAAAKIRRIDIAAKPLDLAFTAVDGRAVDLAKFRGKVVLVDFWATWCGPCKAELPNVKKVYTTYHEKGFEVVGIALENANLAAKETPEQTAQKLAKAKRVLTDFTTAEQMPWPQYFDGKFWKNDLSTRYAINSIPAMFLVDQSGMVVSTNARGEKLEQEVKRLLGL